MWVYGRFMGRTGVEERHDDTLPLAETPRQVIASLGGRYVVERELGRGGMGVVLLARDEKLGRNVALKVLSRSASAEQLQRFEQEAPLPVGDPVADEYDRQLVRSLIERKILTNGEAGA